MVCFISKTSKRFSSDLGKVFPRMYPQILEKFKDSLIYIIDNPFDNYDFEYSKLVNKRKTVFHIFRKDEYVFFGPLMKSITDACPKCLLLTLAVDSESLESFKNNSTININKTLTHNFQLKDITIYIHCVDLNTGKVFFLKKPFSHPSCSHFYDRVKRDKHEKKGHLPYKEIFKKVSDKYTGIIRETKLLSDIASTEIKRKMNKYDVIFSWFQNPVFPLFPHVGFLDLAIGTDKSQKVASQRSSFEALERYSILGVPLTEPDRIATYENLGSRNSVNPTFFWKYSDEQLGQKNFIFMNPSKNTILRWRIGTNLVGEEKLVPEDYVYVNFRNPTKFHNNSTSGCAAHIDYYRACLNATLELIERDNIMRHWVMGEPTLHIDLKSMKDTLREELIILDNFGFDIKIINCSRFPGIYTFIILLTNRKNSRPKVIVTSGCDLNAREAILKGVREAIGSLLISLILEEKNGPTRLTREDVFEPEDHAIFYRDPVRFDLLKHYYEMSQTCSIASLSTKYLVCNYELILKHIILDLKNIGVNLYFFDLTFLPLKELGVHVIRAVSPELMPIMFGTGNLKLGGSYQDHLKYQQNAILYPHPFS